MHPPVAVLIDLIGSRVSQDRQGMHDTFTAGIAAVTRDIPAHRGPAVSTGDEIHSTYSSLGQALATIFKLRVQWGNALGVRFGIGRGPVTVLDAAANTQDGPGWWAAREAINHVSAVESNIGWPAVRTAYRGADHDDPIQDAVNAALLCQDLLIHSWDARTWSIAGGIMAGHTQKQIAAELGISRQAVQQRRSSAGLPMVLAAADRLAALP